MKKFTREYLNSLIEDKEIYDNFITELVNTKEERVRLLKMGLNIKHIEQLYIKYNSLIVTNTSDYESY